MPQNMSQPVSTLGEARSGRRTRRTRLATASLAACVVFAAGPGVSAQEPATQQPPTEADTAEATEAASRQVAPESGVDRVRVQTRRLTREVQKAQRLGLAAPLDAETRQRLAALAEQLDTLVDRLETPAPARDEETDRSPLDAGRGEELAARHEVLQAYEALANRAAQVGEQTEASVHLGRLRTAAVETQHGGDADARWLGAFWLLQADLFDLNRARIPAGARREQAVARLTRFLDQREAPPAHPALRAMRDTTRGALLELLDHRGQSRSVARRLEAWSKDPTTTDEARGEWAERFAWVELLGKKFQAELTLVSGRPWSALGQRGNALVVWFVSPASPVTRQGLDAFAARATETAGLRLLVVVIEGAGGPDDRWRGGDLATGATKLARSLRESLPEGTAVFLDGTGDVRLQRLFHIRSLPRLVRIDTAGRVAALGGDAVAITASAVDAGPDEIPPSRPRLAPVD